MKNLLLAVSVLLFIFIFSACEVKPMDNIYRNYYEIFVGSFYDSNADGIGDLNGVTEKLDYISKDVGADGIWLTPIHPSSTYHKYDVIDYYDIDKQFGTLEDFDNLIKEAHKRDMSIILDLVVQHSSSEHPWFLEAVDAKLNGTDSKYIDYYKFADTAQTGYAEWQDSGLYYACVFSANMPDFNLDNEELRSDVKDIMTFWLDRGADGFRLDAVTSYYVGSPSKNAEFLTWLNTACKEIKPDAYIVGEAWTAATEILTYYETGIDGFFNYPFATVKGTINTAINNKNGAALSAAVEKWNADLHAANPNAADAPFISNHDNPRPSGYLMRDEEREKFSAAVYLLMPGTSFIYYGEEIGMLGSGIDPNKRMPMVWTYDKVAVEKIANENANYADGDASYSPITIDYSDVGIGLTDPPPGGDYAQEDVVPVEDLLQKNIYPNSLLTFYHDVLEIKAKYPAIARGTYTALETDNKEICAYRVTYDGKDLFIYENLSADDTFTETLTQEQTGTAKGLKLKEQLLASGHKITLDARGLTLPSMSVAILE